MTNPPGRKFISAFVLIALCLLAAGLWRALPDTVDDAYITFHCIENFVHGEGLTFNAGTRVESFSNPLVVLLLIVPAALGFSLPLIMKILGVLSFACAVIMVFSAVATCTKNIFLAAAAAITVASNFPLLYYSVTGLETGIMSGLIAAIFARSLQQKRSIVATAFLWTALLICRPEAPLYFLAYGAVVILPQLKERQKELIGGVIALSLFAALLCMRRIYYGLWLPNTFYAKAAGSADLDPATSPLAASVYYVLEYFWRLGICIPILALWSLFLPRRSTKMCALAFIVPGITFAFYSGGDWFPASRYLVPITPVLIAAAFLGFHAVGDKLTPSQLRLALGAVIGSAMLTSAMTLYEFTAQRARYPYHVMNGSDCVEASQWMKQNLPPDTRIVAYRIGALGSVTNFHVVDVLGLADNKMARIVAHTPAYHPARWLGDNVPELHTLVMNEHPTAILGVQLSSVPALPFRDLFGSHYTLLKAFPQGEDQLWTLYIRNE